MNWKDILFNECTPEEIAEAKEVFKLKHRRAGWNPSTSKNVKSYKDKK